MYEVKLIPGEIGKLMTAEEIASDPFLQTMEFCDFCGDSMFPDGEPIFRQVDFMELCSEGPNKSAVAFCCLSHRDSFNEQLVRN